MHMYFLPAHSLDSVSAQCIHNLTVLTTWEVHTHTHTQILLQPLAVVQIQGFSS